MIQEFKRPTEEALQKHRRCEGNGTLGGARSMPSEEQKGDESGKPEGVRSNPGGGQGRLVLMRGALPSVGAYLGRVALCLAAGLVLVLTNHQGIGLTVIVIGLCGLALPAFMERILTNVTNSWDRWFDRMTRHGGGLEPSLNDEDDPAGRAE